MFSESMTSRQSHATEGGCQSARADTRPRVAVVESWTSPHDGAGLGQHHRGGRRQASACPLSYSNGWPRAETALAAMRRGFRRVEMCRITTPRAGACTTGQTVHVPRLGWLESAHPDTLFNLLWRNRVSLAWGVSRHRLAHTVRRAARGRWSAIHSRGRGTSVATTYRRAEHGPWRLANAPGKGAAHPSWPSKSIKALGRQRVRPGVCMQHSSVNCAISVRRVRH
jgi:hypothetical protein